MLKTGYALKADTVQILDFSKINYAISANTLIPSAVPYSTPLLLPVIGVLPQFQTAIPGTKDTTFMRGETPVLAPGKYRDVILETQAVVKFSGGLYDIRNLWVKNSAKLYVQGESVVRLSGGFSAENGSYTGPEVPQGPAPSSIQFFIATTDAASQFPGAVVIGPQNEVRGNFYAPNGTIWLKNLAKAEGSFLAEDILVGTSVTLRLASSFTGLNKGPEERQENSELPSEIPAIYSLEQNYPNPFNPATRIRFGLPEPGQVTLAVYDLLGQEIARLVDEYKPAGVHEVRWDGTNRNGRPVGTGAYFYRIQAGRYSELRKMIILK
jgi:hypothetical protein